MTESAPTLKASNVHVTYRSRQDANRSLRDLVGGDSDPTVRKYRDIQAVRGVNLTLHQGESLGIVGGNGSGKSTLLGALAGLIELEDGEILAASRPALLGVGAVLNRKLSGRRNIEIGCLALGLSTVDVRERMDSIIEFSGLAQFIDLPMKTYSSGMRARLAFTIATELAPDILLIDEALAVGDETFRKRAAERLEEIRASAGSIIVVSHSLREISQMCTRVIWLDQGQIRAEGEPEQVLEQYRSENPMPEKAVKNPVRRARRKARRQARQEAAIQAAVADALAESTPSDEAHTR